MFILTSVLLILFSLNCTDISYAKSQWAQTNVAPDKIWTIKFNMNVLDRTIKDNIFANDSEGNILNDIEVGIINNPKEVVVYPPKDGYKYGGTYVLHIKRDIHALSDTQLIQLKETVEMEFTIADKNLEESLDKSSLGNLALGGNIALIDNNIIISSPNDLQNWIFMKKKSTGARNEMMGRIFWKQFLHAGDVRT